MQAHKIKVSGKWGHFRRPAANNNPITYDFITKTAFIGLLAAVVGYSRSVLKEEYKAISEDLLYNVTILRPIKKVSTSFRIYKYKGSLANVERPPQFYEFLKDAEFEITFTGTHSLIKNAVQNIREGTSIFTPTLGLINCPAAVEYIETIRLDQVDNGVSASTRGFVPYTSSIRLSNEFTVSYDNVPVAQGDSWNNTKYKKVFYGYMPEDSSIVVDEPSSEKFYEDTSGRGYFLI